MFQPESLKIEARQAAFEALKAGEKITNMVAKISFLCQVAEALYFNDEQVRAQEILEEAIKLSRSTQA